MNLEGCLSFPNGDFRLMARLISSLFEDEYLRKKLSKSGKNQIFRDYTWEQSAKKLEKVYLSLLNGVEK